MDSRGATRPEVEEKGKQAGKGNPREEFHGHRKKKTTKRHQKSSGRSSNAEEAHSSDSSAGSNGDVEISEETDSDSDEITSPNFKGRRRARKMHKERGWNSSSTEGGGQGRRNSSQIQQKHHTSRFQTKDRRFSAPRLPRKDSAAQKAPAVSTLMKTTERNPTHLDQGDKNHQNTLTKKTSLGSPKRSTSTDNDSSTDAPVVAAVEQSPPADTFHTLMQTFKKMYGSTAWKWSVYVLSRMLIVIVSILGALLYAAVWLRWADNWTPALLQRDLRVWTDYGSRAICDAPGMSNLCVVICTYDDYSDIFPTVCSAEGSTPSFDDAYRDAYNSFSEAMGVNDKMYSAPLELSRHRNSIILYRDKIEAIYEEGEVENVDFESIKGKLQTIFGWIEYLPEEVHNFLIDVGIIPNTLLYQSGATKNLIGEILRNSSAKYDSTNGNRRMKTPQELLRARMFDHIREWKVLVERVIEPGQSIQTKFLNLKSECLSLKKIINKAIKEILSQKRGTTGPWKLYKRLAVHFGLVRPQEIAFLLNALDQVKDLDAFIDKHAELFTIQHHRTVSTNGFLRSLMVIVNAGKGTLFEGGEVDTTKLIAFTESLELHAKEIQAANDRAGGRPSPI